MVESIGRSEPMGGLISLLQSSPRGRRGMLTLVRREGEFGQVGGRKTLVVGKCYLGAGNYYLSANNYYFSRIKYYLGMRNGLIYSVKYKTEEEKYYSGGRDGRSGEKCGNSAAVGRKARPSGLAQNRREVARELRFASVG